MKRESADERFMRSALSEARKALGLTSPNPAVGAILRLGDRIVARGHHRGAGFPHAEVECLRHFKRPIPADATLYVTLEPCSTAGRTPPCTDEIVQANIKNVVIGAIDPNPQHSGRGIELLRDAGIEIRTGVLNDECTSLNEPFNKWIVTGFPLVTAKCAMTLDGRLTRPPGEPMWISGPGARKQVHELRARVDAILVGAETVRSDNPRLTVRGARHQHQPVRVVLTRSGKLPSRGHLFTDRFASRTIVFKNKPLQIVLRELGRMNMTHVLIEGGGGILAQALDAQLIDRIQLYLGPLLAKGPVLAFGGRGAGDTSEAIRVHPVEYQRIGDDICISGRLVYPTRTE